MSGKAEEMEVFAKVYGCHSLSQAAHLTGLTPSGISRLIKRLEIRLGIELFYRNSRSIRPTPEGDIFYSHCIQVLQAMELAEAAVCGHALPDATLRVNTLPSFARCQLAPRMPAFHERYPRIRVEFILGVVPSDPIRQRIDVAIYAGQQTDSNLIARRLTTARWMLVASPEYLARFGTPERPEDLAKHQCLNFTIPAERNTWRFHSAACPTFTPRAIASSNQGDMLLELALAGMGIARLADFHVTDALNTGRLTTVLSRVLKEQDEPIYMLYHSRNQRSPRVTAWLDFMHETFDLE